MKYTRIAAFIIATAIAIPALAIEFIHINESGYTTTFVAINTTSSPITFTGFPDSIPGSTNANPPVLFSTDIYRYPVWPVMGRGGILDVSVPNGIYAYTEIQDPRGIIIRVPPLVGSLNLENKWLYDLASNAYFQTYLFLAAPASTGAQARLFHFNGNTLIKAEDIRVQAAQIVIVTVPSTTTKTEVAYLSGGGPSLTGQIRGFAMISHQPAGELMLVFGTGKP